MRASKIVALGNDFVYWIPGTILFLIQFLALIFAAIMLAIVAPTVMIRVWKEEHVKRRSYRMYRSPGWTLHRFGRWFFSPRTLTEILEPALSDMQVQFCDALKDGRPLKARWVQLRGYWRFWTHIVALAPVSLARVVFRLWRLIH